MRRLTVLGILLLLTACSDGGAGEPEAAAPSSATSPTPTILVEDTPPPDPTEPVAGDHRLGIELVEDASPFEYLLHAPPAVERGRPLALVLVFHGRPGSPEDMVRTTRFDALADRDGFLVVYPDNFGDPEQIGVLLDHLAGLWPIDERRIYAAGFSAGASTTYGLADELSERIAAFAPVSGIQYGDFSIRRPASLITFQGEKDEFASAFGRVNRAWSRAAGCERAIPTEATVSGRPARRTTAACEGGSEHVVYRVERMGHVWPRDATPLIWDFFAAHPLTS